MTDVSIIAEQREILAKQLRDSIAAKRKALNEQLKVAPIVLATTQAAALEGDGKPVDENPPADLLHALTRQQRKIVTHLWKVKHATNWRSLPDDCWQGGHPTSDQNDRTIESALERLRDKLNTLPRFGLTLEVHSGTTELMRNPQRK